MNDSNKLICIEIYKNKFREMANSMLLKEFGFL